VFVLHHVSGRRGYIFVSASIVQTLFRTPLFVQLREIVVKFNEGLIELNTNIQERLWGVCEHT